VTRVFFLIITSIVLNADLIAQNVIMADWQTDDDFRRAEDGIKQNILWLENNPIASSSNDTKAITENVLNWLTHVPYLSVTYDEIFLESLTSSKYKFGDKFRVTYLFGKSYYVINHPHDSVSIETKASARGIEGMVKVYQELKKMDPSVRHRVLEKYSRLVRQEKLHSYTESALAKSETDTD
jgi:hypothetical protein